MKMTEDAMARCSSLLKDFANRKGFRVNIDHEIGERQTKICFQQPKSMMAKNYWLEWDTMVSISEGCAYIFADLIQAWNLGKKITTAAGHKPFIEKTLCSVVPEIKNVIFNNPATIIIWEDGTKTVVKVQDGDTYYAELGMAMCIAKKALGNKGNFNEIFKKWLPVESEYPSIQSDLTYEGPMTRAFKKLLIESIEEILDDSRKRGPETV